MRALQVLSSRTSRLALAGIGAAICAACSSGGGGVRLPAPPADASAPASPLEGEWTLTGLQLADGSMRRVTGFVRFDRFSNITLQAELAPDDPAARPPRTVVANFTAKAATANGELDFTGLSLGVGPERLAADAVAMDDWRRYEVSGSTLRISARDPGGRATATLVFERAR